MHVRKRSVPFRNINGDLPYKVCDTEYGKIGIIICADGYENTQAKALKELGAQII